jgi:hypothetical protein
MKTKHKNKTLTFAEFVANVYDSCGSRRAKEIVRFAVNAHWVEFRGKQRFLIY